MFYAACEGHMEIVKLLLSQPNIDINCKNILIQNHLFYSCQIVLMIFKFIIIFGISIERIYNTAIDCAKAKNHQKIVELLVNGQNE